MNDTILNNTKLKIVQVDKASIIACEHIKPIYMYKVYEIETGKRLATFEFYQEKSIQEVIQHYNDMLINDNLPF